VFGIEKYFSISNNKRIMEKESGEAGEAGERKYERTQFHYLKSICESTLCKYFR